MARLAIMRRLVAAFATCSVVVAGCATSTTTAAPEAECVQHYDPNTDYFPDKVHTQDATHFSVEYHKNYKIVTVTEPWPGSTMKSTYVLVRCGTSAPAGYQPEQIVSVPLRRTVMLERRNLSYYDDLGVLGSIVGMNTSDAIGIPEVVNRIRGGQITSVGSSLQHQVDVEKLLALNPDAVFDVGTGNPTFDVYQKVAEAGGKVVLGYYSRTYWYVANADGYMGAYLRDAGATNALAPLLSSNRGSNKLSFENILANETGAQYWLNQSQFWKTAQDALAADSRYSQFTALTNGHAYNNNGQLTAANGNMFYQTGGTEPDVILQDLVKICHPELLLNHQLVYYRKLE